VLTESRIAQVDEGEPEGESAGFLGRGRGAGREEGHGVFRLPANMSADILGPVCENDTITLQQRALIQRHVDACYANPNPHHG